MIPAGRGEPDAGDVRAGRAAALEEELRRLRARQTQIRAELADLRVDEEPRIPPPAQWSKAKVTIDDVELVLRKAPETEWTVSAIREHLPQASIAQVRRQLLRMTKLGLVRTTARGRYVLAPLSPKAYRQARGPRPPLRTRVLDVLLADENRAWTKRELAAHLELPDRSIANLNRVMIVLQREHYVAGHDDGRFRPLPAAARNALNQRADTEVLGIVAPRTRTRSRSTVSILIHHDDRPHP